MYPSKITRTSYSTSSWDPAARMRYPEDLQPHAHFGSPQLGHPRQPSFQLDPDMMIELCIWLKKLNYSIPFLFFFFYWQLPDQWSESSKSHIFPKKSRGDLKGRIHAKLLAIQGLSSMRFLNFSTNSSLVNALHSSMLASLSMHFKWISDTYVERITIKGIVMAEKNLFCSCEYEIRNFSRPTNFILGLRPPLFMQ